MKSVNKELVRQVEARLARKYSPEAVDAIESYKTGVAILNRQAWWVSRQRRDNKTYQESVRKKVNRLEVLLCRFNHTGVWPESVVVTKF